MVSVAAQRVTAYSIIREIGNEVLRNRILPELEDDFTSHEFIKKLVFLFREEYHRMQEAHADCGDSAHRNQIISRLIGLYLWRNSRELHIERVGALSSKNINYTSSIATVWHKTL